MSKIPCKVIRKAIEMRDFIGWNGIPDSCELGDLFDNLPTDLSNRPVRSLGESFKPSTFVLLEMDGYYRPTASIRNNKLVLFDGMNPEVLGGLTALLDDLDEPAARLGWFYGTLEIPAGEWIYPERGITLFLNTTADKVLHVAVYHSTKLVHYMSTLRPSLRKELKPLSDIDMQ